MPKKSLFKFFNLCVLLFFIDLFSKAYIQSHVPLMTHSSQFYPYGGIPIFHNFLGVDFSINHVSNKGAAWGIFSSLQHYLLILRLIIIAGLIYYLFYVNRSKKRELPLLLVVTGALGNVVDYFVYGHVVDMFHFRFGGHTFPIFNIADACIFCGIALLFLQSWKKRSLIKSI